LGGIGDTAEFAAGARVNNADVLKDSVSAFRARDRNAAFAKVKLVALCYGIQAPPD
jgi:hypothetical protein